MSDDAALAVPEERAEPEKKKSIRTLALQGAVWTLAGDGGSQIIRFVSSLILTRLLVPDAFGAMVIGPSVARVATARPPGRGGPCSRPGVAPPARGLGLWGGPARGGRGRPVRTCPGGSSCGRTWSGWGSWRRCWRPSWRCRPTGARAWREGVRAAA